MSGNKEREKLELLIRVIERDYPGEAVAVIRDVLAGWSEVPR